MFWWLSVTLYVQGYLCLLLILPFSYAVRAIPALYTVPIIYSLYSHIITNNLFFLSSKQHVFSYCPMWCQCLIRTRFSSTSQLVWFVPMLYASSALPVSSAERYLVTHLLLHQIISERYHRLALPRNSCCALTKLPHAPPRTVMVDCNDLYSGVTQKKMILVTLKLSSPSHLLATVNCSFLISDLKINDMSRKRPHIRVAINSHCSSCSLTKLQDMSYGCVDLFQLKQSRKKESSLKHTLNPRMRNLVKRLALLCSKVYRRW